MPRKYRRRRLDWSPPPEPASFTRRDEHTFWAWGQDGELLGYVTGQSGQLQYGAVRRDCLVTTRDEKSYWAWDERALLLGLIVKNRHRYDCFLPDGSPHKRGILGEKTLRIAWLWLRRSRQ